MTHEIERRTFTLKEIRANDGASGNQIAGYAAVFNSLSEDLGGFYERIQPGAFAKTVKEADVRALFNHDPNYVLGRNRSETLSLSEDDIGLAFEVEPPDTSWVRDLLISIRRGDINQMSFGFRTIRDKWEAVGEQIVRTLIEVQLFDVSLVAFPAYTATSASVRSAYEAFLTANSNHRAGSDNPPGGGTQVQGVTSLQHLRRLLDLAELED